MSFAPGWGRNTDGDKDIFEGLRNENNMSESSGYMEEDKVIVPITDEEAKKLVADLRLYAQKNIEEEKIRVPYKGLPDEALIDKSKINPIKPDHYDGKECLDIMMRMVKGKPPEEAILISNVIKYLYRYNRKDGIKDVKKAVEYTTFLVELLEKK